MFESGFKNLKSQLEEKFPNTKIIIAGKKVRKVGTFDVEIEGGVFCASISQNSTCVQSKWSRSK